MTRRDRGGGSTLSLIAVVLAAGLLVGPGPVAVEAFSTGGVDRQGSLTTVGDGSGGATLDPYHGMQSGEQCKLVDVTNSLGTDLSVTVSLRSDSTGYGNLTIGNGDEGDEVTFSVGVGATQRVDIQLATNLDDGTKVFFHVNATSAPVEFAGTDRYSTVNSSRSGTECSA
ncbi:hypothetical protein [Haloparvum sp. AD34]